MTRLIGNQGFRYLLVGAFGFMIDAGGMKLLIEWAGLSPLGARVFSFPLALSVTWLVHRNWTFGQGRIRAPGVQYTLYLFIQLIGLGINYGIFAALVIFNDYWRNQPVLALAIGASVALIVTFVLSRAIAFAGPK